MINRPTLRIMGLLKTMRLNDSNGFTLVELGVVIAILAIAATIAIPNMIGWKTNAMFRSAVNGLTGDLAVAKQSAMSNNANSVVTFGTHGYRIFIDNGSGGGSTNDGIQNGTEPTLRAATLPSGVSFNVAGATFSGARTGFTRRGLCRQAGSIALRNRSNRCSISINRLGRIVAQ